MGVEFKFTNQGSNVMESDSSQKINCVTPVLLAGGSGTRLWPLSRKSYPKQFSRLINEKSLFQESALRLVSSDIIEFSKHITVTNDAFRFTVLEQFEEIKTDPGTIIIEPKAKNTASAILAASLCAFQKDPESILLVAPSDHNIPDISSFHTTLNAGFEQVLDGNIVTFGIAPSHPETGYGYIEVAGENLKISAKVKKFVEKPDFLTAQSMLATGNYFWNAGIFMFKAENMLDAFKKIDPEMLDLTTYSIASGKNDLAFFRPEKASWDKLEDISIDFKIMENLDNLVVIPYTDHWSDLGDWQAVWSEHKPDEDGVVISENVSAINCRDSLLRSENKGQQLVGVGLDGIVAIAMPDAVLVSKKDHSQEVKKVVETLKLKNVEQAETFPKDHRPWGWYEVLINAKRFQVKQIFVKPGALLSLQSHHHRSEHWIVVKGTAKVTIDESVKLVTEGESVFVPLGAVHRLENPGKLPMVLIEVQTGPYLKEDDIVRYEDQYSRTTDAS